MPNREQELWKDILVNIGLLTEEQLEFALREQEETGERLSDVLVRLGFISKEDLTQALSAHFGLVPVKLSEYNPTPEVVARIPPPLARKYKIVPLEFKDGVLTIALSDPLDFLGLENLEKMLGMKIKAVLANEREIEQMINRLYGVEEETIDTILEELTEQDITFAQTVSEVVEETELTPHSVEVVYLRDSVEYEKAERFVADKIVLSESFDVTKPPSRYAFVYYEVKLWDYVETIVKKAVPPKKLKVGGGKRVTKPPVEVKVERTVYVEIKDRTGLYDVH